MNKDSTVNGIGNSKVIRAKIDAKIAKSKTKNQSKNKNWVKPFLAKSQAFTQSSRSGFLIFEARLAFTKLRKAFIKVLIFHCFDLDYYIYIEINASGYAIV